MTELDERKAAILRAIVEHYVDSAQPVGSQTVTQTAGLGVSAATVRNEMSVLERDGFIAQPHTSAGRVPTDSGYRYYVDHLAGAGALAPAERRRIADFFTTATMAMDDLLHETSQLLARVTAHAAVVVGPQPESVHVRSVHLALLQPRLHARGRRDVERRGREGDGRARRRRRRRRRRTSRARASPRTSPAAASAELPTHDLRRRARRSRRRARRRVVRGARRVRRLHHDEPLYVGGASRLAAEQEAFASTSASGLLELLEQHVVLGALLRELLGPGLTVRIGAENELADLRECSLVLAPYLVEGEADRNRRRARPDPHGLPQGAGRGVDRVAPARTAALPLSVRCVPLMARDAYEVLGVTPQATDDEIKRAYRQLARECHPDANPDDPTAADRFKEINAAYESVRDPERRRQYDMFGARGGAGRRPATRSRPGSSVSTTCSTRSSAATCSAAAARPAPRRGPDAETVMELTLAEVVTGVRRTVEMRMPVECDTCDGSGGMPGTHPTRCATCDGVGEVRQVRKSLLGQIVTAGPVPEVLRARHHHRASRARRAAATAASTGTRSIDVDVPAGIDDGQRLRLAGRGPAAPRGGDARRPVRRRAASRRTPRSSAAATTSGTGSRSRSCRPRSARTVQLETLDGPREIEVQSGTQPGARLRLHGLGVPSLRTGRRGDLVLEVNVQVPTNLNPEQAELLAQLARAPRRSRSPRRTRGCSRASGRPSGRDADAWAAAEDAAAHTFVDVARRHGRDRRRRRAPSATRPPAARR